VEAPCLRIGVGLLLGVVEWGEALAEGVEGGLGAAAEVGLGEDVADVGADGGPADGETLGGVQVAVYMGDDARDLELADCEGGRSRATWRRAGSDEQK
jgi:hypothetical protein